MTQFLDYTEACIQSSSLLLGMWTVEKLGVVVGGGWWVVVLKGTLVFCFGPNLKLRFWPRPKLNNIFNQAGKHDLSLLLIWSVGFMANIVIDTRFYCLKTIWSKGRIVDMEVWLVRDQGVPLIRLRMNQQLWWYTNWFSAHDMNVRGKTYQEK